MFAKEKISELLNKAYNDTKASYIGLFVKGKILDSKYTGRFESVEEKLSKMIEKSLDINTAIKDFNAEFLFVENKDKNFAIFVYYVTIDIAICILHTGKPNFSLFKIVASDMAKEIKPLEKDLLKYFGTNSEYIEKSIENYSSEMDKTLEYNVNNTTDNYGNLSFNVKELEEILSQDLEVNKSKDKDEKNIDNENEEIEDMIAVVPDLAEILQKDTDNNTNIEFESTNKKQTTYKEVENLEQVFSSIENVFLKYIGPFGKFLFKKKKEEFFKAGKLDKTSIINFCDIISEEIPDNKKRVLFLEEVKGKLLNI